LAQDAIPASIRVWNDVLRAAMADVHVDRTAAFVGAFGFDRFVPLLLSDLDLYMAGTIDQTEAQIKPFVLMSKIVNAVKAWEGAKRAGHEGALTWP